MPTIVNWDNKSRVELVPSIGTFLPVIAMTLTPTSAEDSAGTLSVTISQLRAITGYICQIRTASTGAVITADAKITKSGNVLTVADGAATYNMATTDEIALIVWGLPKA